MSDDEVPKKVQTAEDGVGALYHRTYEVTFRAEGTSPEAIMAKLQADLNAPSAQALATFEKTRGEAGVLRIDDEYLIHITGPYNGPVRVGDVTPRSFRLLTLAGHMEAGEITFAVRPAERPDEYVFRIESRARSHDRLVDLVYDKIPVARAAQTGMWDAYCRAVATANMTGEQNLDVVIQTERRDEKTGAWERLD